MEVGRERRRLVIDHLHVLEPGLRAIDQLGLRDGGVVRTIGLRFGIAPVDHLVGGEVRIERDIENAWLACDSNELGDGPIPSRAFGCDFGDDNDGIFVHDRYLDLRPAKVDAQIHFFHRMCLRNYSVQKRNAVTAAPCPYS